MRRFIGNIKEEKAYAKDMAKGSAKGTVLGLGTAVLPQFSIDQFLKDCRRNDFSDTRGNYEVGAYLTTSAATMGTLGYMLLERTEPERAAEYLVSWGLIQGAIYGINKLNNWRNEKKDLTPVTREVQSDYSNGIEGLVQIPVKR